MCLILQATDAAGLETATKGHERDCFVGPLYGIEDAFPDPKVSLVKRDKLVGPHPIPNSIKDCHCAESEVIAASNDEAPSMVLQDSVTELVGPVSQRLIQDQVNVAGAASLQSIFLFSTKMLRKIYHLMKKIRQKII